MSADKGKVSRRAILKAGGVLSVLVAGGGVYRAVDSGVFSSGTGPAFEPWEDWRASRTSGALKLVHAAILSANAHNTQPWLFRLTEQRIELFADPARHLGSFDPFRREMYLSLGCALANLQLAAAAEGYHTTISHKQGRLSSRPDWQGPEPVAAIALLQNAPAPTLLERTLYEAIPNRHTDRAVYDSAKMTDELLRKFEPVANTFEHVRLFWTTEPEKRRRYATECVAATERIIADHVMVNDSQRWFCETWDDLQTRRSGPHIDVSGAPPIMRVLGKMLPPLDAETAHGYWLDATRRTAEATGAFGTIAVRDKYDRAQSLEAGMVWQRLHLLATSLGISMQPFNMMVECDDRERELGRSLATEKKLADLINTSDWQPTFQFRAGHPTAEALPSARRALEDVLLS
ncbi:MAG: hypothetical protein H7A21_07690 [Spirochaetales bacterium]|nr:hypothetical protein [Leptospiraceae bacterium]MCP5481296.1 hypothetical protein [Spirochaetales bacterium]MCP5485732.1 hypothetical protein [Spirochaetales bacterium]